MPLVPHQSEMDRQVDASMRMFESAQVGPAAVVSPETPRRVLVCLDGSKQDDASIAAVLFFHKRWADLHVTVLDARERDAGSGYAAEWATRLGGGSVAEVHSGDAYDRILQAVEMTSPDLVVVPCPFGRDFESVGIDSAGTVIDVLLCRCHKPMLVIRRIDEPLEEAARELVVVVSGELTKSSAWIGWPLGIAAEDGLLRLDLVVEHAQYESLAELLHVLAPGQAVDRARLEEALTEAHSRLHTSMAASAAAAGLRYQLRVDVGDPEPLSDDSRRWLIVLPLEQDQRHGHGFVQDRIRRSPHPVLVIPTGDGPPTQEDCLR